MFAYNLIKKGGGVVDSKRRARDYNEGYAAGYRAGLADGMAGKIGAEAEENLLLLPLELLDLSARTRNALTGYGCVRIGDVAQIPEEKIRCIRNLGPKRLE